MSVQLRDEGSGTELWWKDAIIYEVWPKSFYSGRGTATGDLPGLISKLDYIKALGANTIWLAPHYSSPLHDEGYDISDYNNVNPLFGTMQDADNLIKECHSRGLRIIFDLVINHTSDEHAWFKESRSSKDNAKADWYIWKPAKYDKEGNRMPPNNWSSWFAQSAWTWEEARQEYYLHLYCIEQPDLNWESEECRKEIYRSAMIFWLNKGLDGFRIDTVNHYSKPLDFPDAPITDPNSDIQQASKLFCNGPRMHEFVKEMGEILNQYGAMSVGELPETPETDKVLEYVSQARKELSMVFPFDIVDLGRDPSDGFKVKAHKLTELKTLVNQWQKFVQGNDAWTSVFLENHDQARCVSRFANDSFLHRVQSAKMLAMLILTQTGTPYIYQGQELGMINMPSDWSDEEYLDVSTINYLAKARKEGVSEDRISKMMPLINKVARDNARTPVQWSDAEYAGFSTTKPWMRVNDNYKEINAAQQLDDPDSVYHFYPKVIALRRAHADVFTYGDFDVHDADNEQVFSFVKTAKSGQKAFVALNFSTSTHPINLPDTLNSKSVKIILSTRSIKDNLEPLQAYEGRVLVF